MRTLRRHLRRLGKAFWIRPMSPSERRARRTGPLVALPGSTAVPAALRVGPPPHIVRGLAGSRQLRALPEAHRLF
jgi:hypothetical protein